MGRADDNRVDSAQPPPHPMPAGFGLATATFVVVSGMVGGGILTTSGFVVRDLGSNQLMLGLWVFGGLIALCGALTLAEMAAALPRAGGEYAILAEAYGPLPAFLWGWVSYLLGFAGPIAATASAGATYLLAPVSLRPADRALVTQLLASVAIVCFAAAHARGRAHAVRLQGAITSLMLAILVSFVIAGLAIAWPRWTNLNDPPPFSQWHPGKILAALVYISYSYTGWNTAAYLAGEIGDPTRRLPRSILLGTGIVIALYLGINVVYALALPAADVVVLARASGPAAVEQIADLAVLRLFGPRMAGYTAIAVGLVLMASLSALILTGPRVLFAMARLGQFPAIAGKLSGAGQTPAVATATLAGTALVMLWTGTFEGIVVYSGFGLAWFSMLSVSAIFVLRKRRPELHRPFRTPGYPVVPGVFLVANGLFSIAVLADPDKRVPALLSVASMLAGIPLFYLLVRPRTGRSH